VEVVLPSYLICQQESRPDFPFEEEFIKEAQTRYISGRIMVSTILTFEKSFFLYIHGDY